MTDHKLSPGAKSCIDKIVKFDKEHPDSLRPEFMDWLQVIPLGAEKHGKNSWTFQQNQSMKHKSNHDSIFHHIAQSFVATPCVRDTSRLDEESGLDHMLHAICRLQYQYTRIQLGIRHIEDKVHVETN